CSIVKCTNEGLTFDSNMIRVRLREEDCDPRFFFYFFQSEKGRNAVRTLSSGAAVTTITGSGLGNLIVPSPPKVFQYRVALILSAYDDLIENNTRRIKILEEM